MKPRTILICTLLGFLIVYFVPYGQYLVPSFWTIYSIVTMIREKKSPRKLKAKFGVNEVQDTYRLVVRLHKGDKVKANNWLSAYNDYLGLKPLEMFKDMDSRTELREFLLFLLGEKPS